MTKQIKKHKFTKKRDKVDNEAQKEILEFYSGNCKYSELSKQARTILSQRKISEYYTGKYDDLDREERAILSQMDLGDREFWHLNHFRNIPSMKNNGEKIAGLLADLAIKGYIVRNQRGGTGYKLMED